MGVEGAVAALFSGNENDALAAWLVMKRGCRIFPIAEKESAKIKGAVNSLIPWNSLREFKISRENELKGLVAEYNLQAVVSADESPKEASIAELPALYPLAFFPKQMRKEFPVNRTLITMQKNFESFMNRSIFLPMRSFVRLTRNMSVQHKKFGSGV